MTIFDKSYLISSIKEYEKFSKSQKAILALLIEFEEDNVVDMSIESLIKMSQFSKTIIYKSLSKLEQMNFIKRERKPHEKTGKIILNKSALTPIIELYTKKNQYLSKKVY